MGNSVIYRPAYDAEVEYLESTGTQYIDTGVIAHIGDVLSFDIVTKFSDDIVSNTWLTGWYAGKLNSVLLGMYQNNIYFTYNLDLNITSVSDGLYDKNHIIYNSPNGIIINDEVVNSSVVNTPLTADIGERSLNIFARWTTNNFDTTPPTIGYFIKAKVYQFKIILNNSLIRDFIPVRMGSVGYLYDKVSKQLFANKGTGNFVLGNDVSNAVIPQQRCVLYFGSQRSVIYERIYEEYKWLVGDGAAYIQGVTYDLWNNHLQIQIGRRDIPWTVNRDVISYGNASPASVLRVSDNSDGGGEFLQVLFRSESTSHIADIRPYSSVPDILDMDFYISNSIFYCIQGGVEHVNNETAHQDGWIAIEPKIYSDKLSYIREVLPDGSYNSNLIPCKLLQPIPAILDGNGIARQAGECGMWDKVSNRFYGNVANSGTFAVKGPKCYEEYKWLKVSVSRNVEMVALPVNSSNLYFKHKHISGANYHYFRTTGEGVVYDYYYESYTYRCSVWNLSTGTLVYRNSDIAVTEDEIVINCNSSNRYVNGYNIPIYGSTIKQVSIITRNRNGFEGLISSITVDGSIRYVPCKLTHGIPASMDANGIARPAGTCGMWDKVNDKFYGNVANSGTFTVSND